MFDLPHKHKWCLQHVQVKNHFLVCLFVFWYLYFPFHQFSKGWQEEHFVVAKKNFHFYAEIIKFDLITNTIEIIYFGG